MNIKAAIKRAILKGGTAALMFGLKMHFDYLIIGACQYRIGTYMNCPYHRKSLEMLTGMQEISNAEIQKLDSFTKNVVNENKECEKTRIYFHYSINDHTYEEQISELLSDLKNHRYLMVEEIKDYEEHNDVAKFFPLFLKKALQDIINNKG